jgi:hypothetical protein
MINISNLFSDEKIKSKESIVKNKTVVYQSLKQGKKFKKYQNKITNDLVKDAIILSGKEGFTNSDVGLTQQTREIIEKNNYTSQQQQNLDNLRQEHQNTLQEYENLLEQINGTVTGYIDQTNPNNPYLNKVVSFTTGETAYVTNQGVVKLIPSKQIWQTLNIPQTTQLQLNIPWQGSYTTSGTQIPSNPPLVSGTPVISGQTLGNEGSNVFVDQLLPANVNPSYMGCYAANSSNNNMTFIGGSPANLTGQQIQNGNFSQPLLTNNSYQYLSNSSQVPGWYFNACLINNSTAWGYSMPYPSGNQCVSIQNTQYICATLTLNTGVNYTITFSACSRNCCNNPNVGNPISLQLYTNLNAFISSVANFTPTPVNKWQNYSYTFTVPTTQTYKLCFSGTNTSGDQSTAIANVSFNGSSTNSGTYGYNDCKQAAIQQGYQYFALQNVNTTSGLGYCAVSNSEPAISQYGNSMVPNKLVALWSSNTGGQTGNSATLSVSGSLQVINSSGQAVYSTPSTNANPSNYLGCYGDGPSRAMSVAYSGGSQKFNNSQCQQAAQQTGYPYYGLQNSTSGTNAQCFLSNNLSQTMEYGAATNCTKISDGSWSGGGWSNAVYNTNSPQSSYFLILQNDGNMCIYRGTGPNNNQGFIWCTMTNGKTQSANPNAAASLGKYGQNWIASGSTLAPGDFVGSSNGNLQLVMQSDGNLVLYTFQMELNCQKMSDGNMGGGVGANASYNIGMKSINSNIGKLAYIDNDSNLNTYPSSNKQYSNTYTTVVKNSNTTGNDIQGAAFNNATVQSCKTACNTNNSCAGFVFDTNNNICYPKTNSMYPFGGEINSDTNSTIYIRDVQPSSPPIGVSQNTIATDTITYKNYKAGGNINNSYGLSKLTSVQQQQMEQLQTKLNQLSKAISDSTTNFQEGAISVENQSKKNVIGIENYLDNINKTNIEIGSVANQNSGSIQNILNDSDIVVLQKNYKYLLWSILAAGTVLVSMIVVKKQ